MSTLLVSASAQPPRTCPHFLRSGAGTPGPGGQTVTPKAAVCEGGGRRGLSLGSGAGGPRAGGGAMVDADLKAVSRAVWAVAVWPWAGCLPLGAAQARPGGWQRRLLLAGKALPAGSPSDPASSGAGGGGRKGHGCNLFPRGAPCMSPASQVTLIHSCEGRRRALRGIQVAACPSATCWASSANQGVRPSAGYGGGTRRPHQGP